MNEKDFNAKYNNKKQFTINKSKTKANIGKLKAGKTYYVRIRAYSKVNGKKYYGSWSKVRKVTVNRAVMGNS